MDDDLESLREAMGFHLHTKPRNNVTCPKYHILIVATSKDDLRYLGKCDLCDQITNPNLLNNKSYALTCYVCKYDICSKCVKSEIPSKPFSAMKGDETVVGVHAGIKRKWRDIKQMVMCDAFMMTPTG